MPPTPPIMRRSFFALLLAALTALPLAAQDTTTIKALAKRDSVDAVKAYNASRSSTVRGAMNRVKARTDSFYRAMRTPIVPAPDTVIVVKPDTLPPPIVVDTAKFDGVAELPRNIPTPPSVACATIVRVLPGTDLQAAINSATPGVCLLLKPGSTFIGNFTLPNKGASSQWVTIQTDTMLPASGTRMTPARAAQLRLAKVLSPSYTEVFGTAPGAHHYILRGLELGTTAAAEATGMNQLLRFTDASDQWSVAGIPNNLWLLQSYVHGTPTLDLRRLERADYRIGGGVDNWLAEAHSNNSDSQCVLWIAAARNQLWRNNYCSGGHEPLMSGGGDPRDSTLIPSDIAIIGNHLGRPVSWKGVWQVKNLVETKNVHRMLIEGNVLDNSWPDAQTGFCFVLKGENQDGGAPWSTTRDVTVRYNLVRGCAGGMTISGRGTTSNEVRYASTRFSVHDNLFTDIGKNGGEGIAVNSLNDVTDLQFRRNTFLNGLEGYGSNKGVGFDGSPAVRWVMDSSVVGHGDYGVKGSGTADGISTLTAFAPGAKFTNNAIVKAPDCSLYPATTTCPATAPATLGADLAKVSAMTAGVVVTDPSFSARRSARPLRLKYARPQPKAICHDATNHPREAAKCDVPLKLD